MKRTRLFESAPLIATVIIGSVISEVQIMEYGGCGSTTVGCVKNYKTRTALDCMHMLNDMLHCNRKWRLL